MFMTATRAIASISDEMKSGQPQLHDLYVLMDDLRRVWSDDAVQFADDGTQDRRAVAVVAATVDVLADELGQDTPPWTWGIDLDEPWFLWPATSPAARMLVMMRTHPAFMLRGVLVPRDIMTRV